MNETDNSAISLVIPVYQPGQREFESLQSLIDLVAQLPLVAEVILVNDSSESFPGPYAELISESVLCRVVSIGENRGRGGAINLGANAARSPFLWIMDSDCALNKNSVYALTSIDLKNIDVIQGVVRNLASNSFWDRYQQQRRSSHSKGAKFGSNTANIIIRKTLFHEIGEFDEAYVRYGFEDRDLLARLPDDIRFVSATDLIVEHTNDLSLSILRKKMFDAASSAAIFKQKFPEEFANMSYAQVDARGMGAVKLSGLKIIAFIENIFSGIMDKLIDQEWVPFFVKKYLVLLASTAAYFRGSCQ